MLNIARELADISSERLDDLLEFQVVSQEQVEWAYNMTSSPDPGTKTLETGYIHVWNV